MKREICCPQCAASLARISKQPDVVAAGESVDLVEGSARRAFRCDGCNAEIKSDERCFAVSIVTAEQPKDFAWVTEYVAPIGAAS